MHLLPVYYTTTNTRKRRKKKTTKREEAALREHEKFLAKHGISTANRSSTVKKSNLASRHASSRSSVGIEQRSSKPWVAGSSPAESANKPTWNPSMAKAKPNIYSGDKIIGIAQMHKSNAVPVSRKDDAVDIARMRRG